MIKKNVFGGYDMSKVTVEEIFVDEPTEDEIDMDAVDHAMLKELEKKQFERIAKQGKFARAYKANIDNIVISNMRDEGKSYREIAKHFDCSPSTIRNRLNKLLGK